MKVPDDLLISEKGNTWLSDYDGNHVAWFKIDERFVEISVTPGNSPGFYLRALPDDENCPDKLARHINLNLSGWTVQRCNLNGVVVGPDNMIA